MEDPHIDCLESAYNKTYPDGHRSESIVYTSLHPDGYPSGSLQKDGKSRTLTARSQPIMGPTMMATRASQLPTRVFTLTGTPR